MHKPAKWHIPIWLDRLGRAGWLAIGLLLCLGVGLYFFSALRTITLPFVIAALGAAVCFPIVNRLERWHLRRSIAALLVLIVMLVVVVAIGLLVLTQLINQSSALVDNLQAGLQKLQESSYGAPIDAAIQSVSKSVANFWKPLLEGFLPVLAQGLGAIASLGFACFIAINIFYYLMADGRRVGRWLGSHIGLPPALGIELVRSSVRSLQGYFAGATVVAAFNGVAIGAAALILGTPMAGVVALINFLFSYIPYIGAIVGGAVAVLLALSGSWTDAMIMLVVLILVNSVFQVVISQIAFGKTLSLHPLVVLLSTTAGGVLAGAIGSALAAPFVAVAIDATRRIGDAGIFQPDAATLPQGVAPAAPLIEELPTQAGERAAGELVPEPVVVAADEPLTAPAS